MHSHTPPDEQTVQHLLWKFAMSSSEHALLLLDRDGNISWANTGAATILGDAPGHLFGRNFSVFFLPEDVEKAIPEHELHVAVQSGTASDDRWMQRVDQSRFWASGVSVYLGEDTPSCVFLKIFRDLTELKMQLETTRERGHSAAQKTEALNTAIALLAHELRNPLGGISLGLELLRRTLPRDENIAHRLESIAANLGHAVVLVDDLMDHSKVSSRDYQLDPRPGTLRELLEASVSIALQQTGQDGRDVPVLVPAGDIQVRVDRMRMQQVFVNLVANALRYTPAAGRIWVTGTIEGPEIIVRVTDEGVGIEPAQLETLFDAFTGSRVLGTRQGLGLGLAVVKKIIALHGGSVQASSEGANKGSQFVVRFPAEVAAHADHGLRGPAGPQPAGAEAPDQRGE